MPKIFLLAVVQSLLLVGGQTSLKMALERMPQFVWSREFWVPMLLNWPFALCGVLFMSAGLLWMWMLRHYPLSTVYPLTSLAYVLALFASVLILHEQVAATKWVGAAFIVFGCLLVAK